MSSFQVDPLQVARAAKRLHDIVGATRHISVQFLDVAPHASKTGDPACAAAYSAFVEQWAGEVLNLQIALARFMADLVSVNNEYVDTEAAISDTPVYRLDVGDL